MNLTERLLDIANIGAEWVLWLLLSLSVVSIAIIAERLVFYLRVKTDVSSMRKKLLSYLGQERIDEAMKHFSTDRTMEAKVLVAGLEGYSMGPTSVGELMAGTLATEKVAYERNLGFLATVGSNTPFLGLFGTVLGIINAFAAMDLTGGTQVDDRIMGAIAEALVATGVGLLVAIPAVVAFNFYRVRVKGSVANAENLAHTLVAHLSSEGRSPSENASKDAA
ncbi:MAG: hypothetical protein AUK47_16015 [Deltaproteobacteria bacterium CG2_30_63_29]|nr:MAG: hypothetical protein AUK47_16015 [Deltaproteobacteria bacterium CG2_30_63_29]PIW00083.1 MAG: MotA/TolQ/ExbB proton channel family protein [Deltaproteobacteria bacterium CG17_big_fil_post_rev_8_21_14_2_50_63_7]PJB45016.1 MAG: MotA/TolQ/ExbB proton channel family protein [Deltaproteobacteria bacterium CG_4_9_14_3_um_filter_63_12]